MKRQYRDSDEDAGYWRALLVVVAIALFCFVVWLSSGRPSDVEVNMRQVRQDTALGPGRDQRGCLHKAGYVWCEGAGKCIRPWQDPCPGGTEFCRSYCAKNSAAKPSLHGAGTHDVFCRCTESGEAEDAVNRSEPGVKP
mmetsp:Transcript_64579/g.120232  ORF Transcript_64579/g.120232 Transcript_64579/m.120232 type:complete len:139 (+) Transcript_64579:114-530(+)